MPTANDTPPTPRTTTEFTTPSDLEVRARRTFDAPRQLLWDVHTRPEHVPHWLLGPDGWTMPVCEIDLRPGGRWRYVWRKDDGREMEMTGVYHEIVPPERLVHTESWGQGWPEAIVTTTLVEADGRTTLTCTSRFPSKDARDRALGTGMTSGWDTSYDRLDAYLRAGA